MRSAVCQTLLVGVLAGLGGCASEAEVRAEYAPQLAEEAVKRELASRMKDPGTVQWQSVTSRLVDSVYYVCGEFNARNSLGAYTGFERFAGRAGDVLTQRAIGTTLETRFNDYDQKCR